MKKGYAWLSAAVVLTVVLTLYAVLGESLLQHNWYDSYSLQAQAWLEGKCTIDGDYSYLELAQYEGRQYLSFPPFPSVFMLPFVLLFGQNTPSGLLAVCLMAASTLVCASFGRKKGLTPLCAACFGAFCVLGCNYCEYALYGSVWNLAQSLAFLLTFSSFRLFLNEKKRDDRISLVLIACAVGCRPFQAVYALFLAVLCVKRYGLKEAARMCILPLHIAFAYAAYNFARFGNPLEFGHNYLPEFMYESEHGQFSLHYVLNNLKNIVRLPYFENGLLLFPGCYGFAFYLTNPVYDLCAIQVVRRRMTWEKALLCVLLAAHFLALLCHKSFGGVQWGTRYLCDLVPALTWLWLSDHEEKFAWWEWTLMGWGVAFNIYGTIIFHLVLYP